MLGAKCGKPMPRLGWGQVCGECMRNSNAVSCKEM